MDPVDPFFSKFLAVSLGKVRAELPRGELLSPSLPLSLSFTPPVRNRPLTRKSNFAIPSKAEENGDYERYGSFGTCLPT